MCRIYGYFGRERAHSGMDAARDAQRAGGPDEQRRVTGAGWGLGCNRLAIQDPSHGCQPFANADGTVYLVFNGEVYNFRAIRDELRRHGVRIDGDSDGSVLLPYYELHGDDFVERLAGMFAIAVVDLREGRRLKLWCDDLAVKSVYYSASADGIAFSSELAALKPLLTGPVDIDPLAVDAYLNWQCLPNGMTWYQGVSSLRPGERMVFDADAASHRRHGAGPRPAGPPGEAATPERLRELLAGEVDRMSLQTGPVAVQISGGLDSSVLATMLGRGRTDVTGFHVSHEGDHTSDELDFARAAAAHAGVPLEVVEIREKDLPELIPEMVAALGVPNATPHAMSAYALFGRISESGIRVCFTGDGADEQFGGYRRYSTALAAGDDSWAERYLDRLSILPRAEYRLLQSTDYREFLDTVGDSRQHARELLAAPASSRLEQILDFDRLHKLPGLNLRKLDHLSMANAVECRVPYCQSAITAFARGAPDPMKVDGPRRKPILLDAGEGLIPDAVRRRAKQPFTFPVTAFMRRGTALWEFTQDVLRKPRLCSAGFLSEPAVRRVIMEHAGGKDHARLLWGLMILELSLPRP